MQRFWQKVNKNGPIPEHAKNLGPCWLWTAGTINSGYGVFWVKPQMVLAHRVSYESSIGKIQKGLTLDHLCRERLCVKPTHLEPVPLGVNIKRGISPAAIHSRQTHCKRGHHLLGENLLVYQDTQGRLSRICRTCKNRKQRLGRLRREGPPSRFQPLRAPVAKVDGKYVQR